MSDNSAFLDSPELYDAIYNFKNYHRECARLHNLISALVPGASRILDVACGTGEHAKFLREHYSVDGVDINEGYLRAARLKNPSGNYINADLMNFDLGRTYDVVICLFSAIGIVDFQAPGDRYHLHGAARQTWRCADHRALVHA
jgi:ubiquinone/menaquinone biosynthesis C-methylase UbiE